MEEDSRPGTAEEGPRCMWCGMLLRDEEARRARRPVCDKCVRLLMSAGVSDEEIFGTRPDDPGYP
ncbi:MAG: hypothetical protein DMF66_00230 [Acidobacteria bacterium]|nr:MAG: hypothetical protein DMF66_00230 [Acidobacteriota bacterium]